MLNERILTKSEVIRAIVLEDSPCGRPRELTVRSWLALSANCSSTRLKDVLVFRWSVSICNPR